MALTEQTILTSFIIILAFALLFWAKFTLLKDLPGGDLIINPILPITGLLNNDSFKLLIILLANGFLLSLLDYVLEFGHAIYLSAIIFISEIHQ